MIKFIHSNCFKLGQLALSLLCAATVKAVQPPPMERSDLQWHGYVSQGFIKTSHNMFFGNSEDGSWEMTDIALGALWQPLSKLQFSAQLLYRQAGATSRDDIYTDYALADLTLAQSMSWKVGLRAGRIKNPVGFYNDTRDIAVNRPSILLPESIYMDTLRDIFHTSNSASVYGHTYLGNHLLQFDLLQGSPIVRQPTTDESLRSPLAGKLDNEKISIARLLVEFFGGKIRAGYTYTQVDLDYNPNPGTQLIPAGPSFISVPRHGYPGSFEITLNTWSLEYNHNNWQFTSEYQSWDTKDKNIIGPDNKNITRSLGYYGMASYQFNAKWRGFIRHDVFYDETNDKDGDQYANETGNPAHNRYAYDSTLGLRYQPNSAWLMAAELHRIKGAGWISTLENDSLMTRKNWTLFSAQISYHF